jgi:hypothetical protein
MPYCSQELATSETVVYRERLLDGGKVSRFEGPDKSMSPISAAKLGVTGQTVMAMSNSSTAILPAWTNGAG